MLRRALLVLGLVLAAGLAWLLAQILRSPSLTPYRALELPAAPSSPGQLRVRFAGVSTLLFDDGETAWMTDAFFSRPSKLATIFGRVAPDPVAIDRALGRLGVTHLAAVVPVHAHYDHAMDAPVVAQRTGALLVGSGSALQIGRGLGLAEDRMREVRSGDVLTLGRFRITFLASRHSPTLWTAADAPSEAILAPLVPPAHATAYKEDTVWSLLVEHGGRSLLVQGSAGFVPGALEGRRAEVVFLGVGTLGQKDEGYRAAYWREVVERVGARRVLPIHWDDFWRSSDDPRAMPYLVDDLEVTMTDLGRRAAAAGVELRMPPWWAAFDPF